MKKSIIGFFEKSIVAIVVTIISIPTLGHTEGKTIGSGGCGLGQNNCHATDGTWWNGDAHKSSLENLYDNLADAEAMAKISGVGIDNMFKGTSNCMQCHATVVTDDAESEAEEGVSCESCHGGGSDYKDPHQAGDPASGYKRTGYVEGLRLGMFELANVNVRAKKCVSCHFINDKDLLRAGHPDGANFNYPKKLKTVANHWDRSINSKDKDKSPYTKAVSNRGPVPKVSVASKTTTSTPVVALNNNNSGGNSTSSPPSTKRRSAVKQEPWEPSKTKTIGPGGCGTGQTTCHATDGAWWNNDAHKSSLENLYDNEEDAKKIARNSGVGVDNMYIGTSSCMKCHATVVSTDATSEAEEGVSCESCHGGGLDYKDPHQPGDPANGYKRTGYLAGIKAGMFEMSNVDVRAKQCVSCHFINDENLLRAGHPDGAGFNYAKKLKTVANHWDRSMNSTDKNKSPYKNAVANRGSGPILASVVSPAGASKSSGSKRRSGAKPASSRRSAPSQRILGGDPFFPLKSSRTINLGPFPQVSDSATVEEILLIVKKRLELLYQQLGKRK